MVPCIIIIVIRKGEERRKREKFYIYSDVTHTHTRLFWKENEQRHKWSKTDRGELEWKTTGRNRNHLAPDLPEAPRQSSHAETFTNHPKTLPRSLETTLTVTQLSRTTWNHAHMGWNLSAAYCWHLLWSFWSTRKECQAVLYFGHGNFAVAAKLPRILVFWDFSLTFSSATVVWKHFFGHHWQAWQWTTCFFVET